MHPTGRSFDRRLVPPPATSQPHKRLITYLLFRQANSIKNIEAISPKEIGLECMRSYRSSLWDRAAPIDRESRNSTASHRGGARAGDPRSVAVIVVPRLESGEGHTMVEQAILGWVDVPTVASPRHRRQGGV